MSSSSNDPATLAMQSFSRGDFATCLRQLSSLPATDPRVEHNRALAELMANDLHTVDKYRSALARIVGVTFPRSDIAAAALRRPVMVYNYAVVLFHARHYRQAGDVLQRLAEEKLDDIVLKRRVVLLSVEVYLCRRQARRALDIIKTNKRLFDKDSPEESVLVSRQSCRAQLLLGEHVEVGGGAESGVEGVVLSAHARLAQGDPVGAAETLARHATVEHTYDARTQGEDIWPAINNNLGVIHLALNKPALAAKYFQTAVKEQLRSAADTADRLVSVRERPLYVLNLGLALLRAGRTTPAFDCLVEAARHFPANARLWRRLADCCVRHAVPDASAHPKLLRYGSGAHTRLAITSSHRQDYSTLGESFAIPNLSLEFAALCLRNALTLLAPQSGDEPTPSAPGAPLSPAARKQLRHSVLTLHSYVLLKLQDPLAALHSATELLRDGTASPAHSILARLHAAEALSRLDRVQEAAEQLHPSAVHELVSMLPRRVQHLIGVQVWGTAAVCHLLRSDTTTARKILAQLDSPRVLPLQIYLEISAGNVDAAVALLRKIPSHTV